MSIIGIIGMTPALPGLVQRLRLAQGRRADTITHRLRETAAPPAH
jgi:hypothetical protein